MCVYAHIHMCIYMCMYTYVASRNSLHPDLREGFTLRKKLDIFFSILPYITSPMCLSNLPIFMEHSRSYAYNVYLSFFPVLPPFLPFNEGVRDCLKPIFPTKT